MPELSILSLLQLIVGLGLLNVWLVRAGSPTEYRGGEARTLKEEFRAYGLPDMAFYLVGGLKIAAGVILVAGLWFDLPVRLAAGVVSALMVGALLMHLKVGDPLKRSIPAAVILVLSGGILLLA